MRDALADDELDDRGFVIVDLLSSDATATLLDLCHRLHPTPRSTWESDFYSPDPAEKRAAHDGIAAVMAGPIGEQFVDHRSLLHNFVVNWPGPDGGLTLHQHSTVVDPERFRSVIVWCALTDADEQNGTLNVVPRSHVIQRGPRPERSESWHEPFARHLMDHHLTSVSVRAGQAIVFDNQLLHCTFPNVTGEPRMTAGAVVVPLGAEPRFYERTADDRMDYYDLDPEFFLSHEAGDLEWARPSGLRHLGSQPWAPTVVDGELLDRELTRPRASRRVGRGARR